MAEIIASDGTKILVDDSDLPILSSYPWYVFKPEDRHTAYACTTIYSRGIRVVVSMHRFILNPKPSEIVDHINRNGLDNRRSNMRLCNEKQNHQNMKKYNRCNTEYASPYKGICWEKRVQLWKAYITIESKESPIPLGYFGNPHDAAEAYNAAATLYFGTFASLNVIQREVDWKAEWKNPIPESQRKTHIGRPKQIKRIA